MRCREVQQKLGSLGTREIASSVRERIEGHVRSCAECREAQARLRRFEDLLTAAPAPPVPEGFAARVVARAKEQQVDVARSKPVRHLSLRAAWTRFELAAGTAAALAAGVSFGVFLGYQTWQSAAQHSSTVATQSAELLASSGFDLLAESRGDSLAETYLQLTSNVNR